MLRFVQGTCGPTGRADANCYFLTVAPPVSCIQNHRQGVRAGRGEGCWSRWAASLQRRSLRSCGSGIPLPSWAPVGRAPRQHRLTVHAPPAVCLRWKRLVMNTSGHSIHCAQNCVFCTPARSQRRCAYRVEGEVRLSLLGPSLYRVLHTWLQMLGRSVAGLYCSRPAAAGGAVELPC